VDDYFFIGAGNLDGIFTLWARSGLTSEFFADFEASVATGARDLDGHIDNCDQEFAGKNKQRKLPDFGFRKTTFWFHPTLIRWFYVEN
jgi:hypothetical protein